MRSAAHRLSARTSRGFAKAHSKIPYLRRVPVNAVGIILFVALVNIIIWVICGIILVSSAFSSGAAMLTLYASRLHIRRFDEIRQARKPLTSKRRSSLLPTAALSYTLGLRHALDADHISLIDLMTRRLVAAGQRPVTVGTFFSLGHST